MTAKLIDGRALARRVRSEYRMRVERLVARHGRVPGLAVILVGDDPASHVYVSHKTRACAEVGLQSHVHRFGTEVSQAEVLACIAALNSDLSIDGILIQLPLPKHFELPLVLGSIARDKDVDGFHLYNVGALVAGDAVFPPCTPYGVQKLLEAEGIPVAGQNVTVVGASNIVGKPMALMMIRQQATVALCHARTRDLAEFTTLADILIVAAGFPNLIRSPMVRPGAVVIDVGINRLPSGQLVGDVDFEGVRQVASHITPVPGGVGPMTVTMLVCNTVGSAERRWGNELGVEKTYGADESRANSEGEKT
ncbi:MAG: bifunctional methylenetetrahydrofolate dehydrogenase/methenyltetrahydrofolate cyclohydrolase FolD [Methylophilaceae bacterium]|uniref:bifunctional methylenetetrahydrofolate dehydrogenase/methenyltetrahydrofolate cyclohydrolase FolD n=1 Tax=Methylibium sp. TaxID=2067992 RepID=UPI00359A6B52